MFVLKTIDAIAWAPAQMPGPPIAAGPPMRLLPWIVLSFDVCGFGSPDWGMRFPKQFRP